MFRKGFLEEVMLNWSPMEKWILDPERAARSLDGKTFLNWRHLAEKGGAKT